MFRCESVVTLCKGWNLLLLCAWQSYNALINVLYVKVRLSGYVIFLCISVWLILVVVRHMHYFLGVVYLAERLRCVTLGGVTPCTGFHRHNTQERRPISNDAEHHSHGNTERMQLPTLRPLLLINLKQDTRLGAWLQLHKIVSIAEMNIRLSINCRHRKIFSLRDIFMEQAKIKKRHLETLILYSSLQ